MVSERNYISEMKIKIIESVDKNEFDKYLMGERDYILPCRELPVDIKPGTGNLYFYMMEAIIELQNDASHYEWGTVLLNGVEQIVDKGPHGILNAVEVIRSIFETPDALEILRIKTEDIKNIVKKIRTESIRQRHQLQETISSGNTRMSVYDCLVFYSDAIFEYTGINLV